MYLKELISKKFDEVWFVDFEFKLVEGHIPQPICMVSKELKSGKEIRLWGDELLALKECPFNIGANSVLVAYYSSAELGCFLVLGWSRPQYILDLYIEYKMQNNGVIGVGYSLLDALKAHRIPSVNFEEKTEMRELAIRGGPFTEVEKEGLLNYCASDVYVLEKLVGAMALDSDLNQILFRGEYMAVVAQMENVGIPLDLTTLNKLNENWPIIKKQLILDTDKEFQVYENEVFKQQLFEQFLRKKDMPWPRTEKGKLKVDDDTFKDMAKSYPLINVLRELRNTISVLKLNKLAVGLDGRNRVMLSPYKSITGRNQPSNSKSIFGPSRWIRGMIKPEEGLALIYFDWSQQEFGIAAALSNDKKMMLAYLSGDPYLAFAKQAGAVPHDGIKEQYRKERAQFKACILAVQYGMGTKSLAERLDCTDREANHLLNLHKNTYHEFWSWSEKILNQSMVSNKISTVFGWTLNVQQSPNPRSLSNFSMQANGAEMLRLACLMLSEAGVKICAPVHDAILVECSISEIGNVVKKTQKIMIDASAIVLKGFELRSDAKIVKYPDRFMDEGGELMWGKIMSILDGHEHNRTKVVADKHICTITY